MDAELCDIRRDCRIFLRGYRILLEVVGLSQRLQDFSQRQQDILQRLQDFLEAAGFFSEAVGYIFYFFREEFFSTLVGTLVKKNKVKKSCDSCATAESLDEGATHRVNSLLGSGPRLMGRRGACRGGPTKVKKKIKKKKKKNRVKCTEQHIRRGDVLSSGSG